MRVSLKGGYWRDFMDLDESETDEKIYGEPQALTEPFPPTALPLSTSFILFRGYRLRQALSSLIIGIDMTIFGYAFSCRHLFAKFWPH